MGLQFFKANKGNTGALAQVSFSSKGDRKGVFVELVKQNGWNSEARNGLGNGVFKDGKKVNVKLSTTEAAGIINAVERREDAAKMVHTSAAGTTQINFVRYKGKVKKDNAWVPADDFTGYSFGVARGEDKISIGLTFSEVVELREYLKFCLEHIFSGIYSDDLKQAKEYAEKKSGGGKSAEKPKGVGDFVSGDGAPDPNGGDDGSDVPF
jgi:hypothetical protein